MAAPKTNWKTPMTDLLHGVDFSHWQKWRAIDFGRLCETHRFGIVRATYGVTPDRLTLAFVRELRRVAMSLGLYHFFKPDEDPTAQFVAFAKVASDARLSPGDIVPTIDVEAMPVKGSNPPIYVHPKRSWVAKIDELIEQFADNWGDVMIYLNGSDWSRLGKPSHWLKRPLWYAHHGVSVPAVPDGWNWRIWQTGYERMSCYSVAADIDQNVARHPLPRIPHDWMTDSERMNVEGWIAMTLREGGSD